MKLRVEPSLLALRQRLQGLGEHPECRVCTTEPGARCCEQQPWQRATKRHALPRLAQDLVGPLLDLGRGELGFCPAQYETRSLRYRPEPALFGQRERPSRELPGFHGLP